MLNDFHQIEKLKVLTNYLSSLTQQQGALLNMTVCSFLNIPTNLSVSMFQFNEGYKSSRWMELQQ